MQKTGTGTGKYSLHPRPPNENGGKETKGEFRFTNHRSPKRSHKETAGRGGIRRHPGGLSARRIRPGASDGAMVCTRCGSGFWYWILVGRRWTGAPIKMETNEVGRNEVLRWGRTRSLIYSPSPLRPLVVAISPLSFSLSPTLPFPFLSPVLRFSSSSILYVSYLASLFAPLFFTLFLPSLHSSFSTVPWKRPLFSWHFLPLDPHDSFPYLRPGSRSVENLQSSYKLTFDAARNSTQIELKLIVSFGRSVGINRLGKRSRSKRRGESERRKRRDERADDNGLAGRPVDIINRNQRLPATEPRPDAGKMSENAHQLDIMQPRRWRVRGTGLWGALKNGRALQTA